jgi:magnesium-transporting ATPase (P-type)
MYTCARVCAAAWQVERDLEVVGVTAIEDKLQDVSTPF